MTINLLNYTVFSCKCMCLEAEYFLGKQSTRKSRVVLWIYILQILDKLIQDNIKFCWNMWTLFYCITKCINPHSDNRECCHCNYFVLGGQMLHICLKYRLQSSAFSFRELRIKHKTSSHHHHLFLHIQLNYLVMAVIESSFLDWQCFG